MKLRFFISSPGDLLEERNLAQETIEQYLQKDEFVRDEVTCQVVRWDDPAAPVPMPATLTPQEAVDRELHHPAQCDVVIVVLWSRMGTPLPDTFKRLDGTTYQSGTVWEYENALHANPPPRIYVYRRISSFTFDPDLQKRNEQLAQFLRVEEFFAQFRNPDGSLRGSFFPYDQPKQFADRLLLDLKGFVKSRLEATAKAKKVGNRSSERDRIHVRSILKSRDLASSDRQSDSERLVPVRRALLDDLKERQTRLQAYIRSYVICRELAETGAVIARGIEYARSQDTHGDPYIWSNLSDRANEASEKLESLPELFKQESTTDVQALEQRLRVAREHLKQARLSSKNKSADYEIALQACDDDLDPMKSPIVSMVVRAKETTDALMTDIQNIIHRILEWAPPTAEGTQDQPRKQLDSYATKQQRNERLELKSTMPK